MTHGSGPRSHDPHDNRSIDWDASDGAADTPRQEPPLPVKCLLVDDLEDNLFTMSALLQAPGVEVITASSGPQALERLLEHDVALALLDVQMPGMDGFELAELIRGSARTRHIPLIFVTAASREQWRLFKGYDVGAVDFLFKPVEPWVLQSKAQVFYELHRSRMRLAQQLRERTETLRMNEMFSAVLAHDLRDPLNVMMTAAAVLERQVDNELLRQSAARIGSSGRHMRGMIADLLDLTRARLAGGIPVKPVAADLCQVVEQVVDQQRAAHPQARIELVCDGSLVGHWDTARLSQMLTNLLGNALLHGTAGEPVLVRADGNGADAVVLTVANDGTVAPESQRRIFEPFHSGSAGKSGDRAGLGLGLYIVNQIVQGHGGTVRVESPAAERTAFTVTLPR